MLGATEGFDLQVFKLGTRGQISRFNFAATDTLAAPPLRLHLELDVLAHVGGFGPGSHPFFTNISDQAIDANKRRSYFFDIFENFFEEVVVVRDELATLPLPIHLGASDDLGIK